MLLKLLRYKTVIYEKSVKCPGCVLQLFTVVRNVKQAHECQEHGETQEFKDDIEYIMDGVSDTMNESVRCLRWVSLMSEKEGKEKISVPNSQSPNLSPPRNVKNTSVPQHPVTLYISVPQQPITWFQSPTTNHLISVHHHPFI